MTGNFLKSRTQIIVAGFDIQAIKYVFGAIESLVETFICVFKGINAFFAFSDYIENCGKMLWEWAVYRNRKP